MARKPHGFNHNEVPVNHFGQAVVEKNVADFFFTRKFAQNASLAQNVRETIWSNGGLWVKPTVAQVHEVVSTSANDTALGTGARKVTVQGLDADNLLIQEVVTMNGTTPVSTTKEYSHLFRAFISETDGLKVNDGDINITAVVDATAQNQIPAQQGQSVHGPYTVPAGFTAYLNYFAWSIGAKFSANIDFDVFIEDLNGLRRRVHTSAGKSNGTSAFAFGPLERPFVIPSGYTIEPMATSDTNNALANLVYYMDIVQDDASLGHDLSIIA
jgi:hypothetical protein